jgi:hypothetical protein
MKRGAFAIRLFLAGIFFYSGIVKASSSAQFAVALAPFTLIPELGSVRCQSSCPTQRLPALP